MGKPLMIQKEDDRRIESIKKQTGAKTKVEVLRAGLTLLEQEIGHQERVRRWKRAAAAVVESSAEVNQEFQKFSRIKHL